jgi:hypothetical protein
MEHVGTAVLGCPVERSSTPRPQEKPLVKSIVAAPAPQMCRLTGEVYLRGRLNAETAPPPDFHSFDIADDFPSNLNAHRGILYRA